MWPFKSKPSSVDNFLKSPPPSDTKPTPKLGDLRIRQTHSNHFFVEEYKNLDHAFSLDSPRWQNIFIYKGSGEIHRSYSNDYGKFDRYYTTLEDAKMALKRRSQVVYDERYRLKNYVNVYYPTEFKKEKFHEDK